MAFWLLPLALASGAVWAAATTAETLAIRAGTLLPVSRPAIRDGVVLVRDGKIVAAGAGVAIPSGTRVIRASVVMPGLVDAHSYLGCYYEADEPVDAITPELRIADGFDARDAMVSRARQAGITTVRIAPGNRNAVAGQMAVIRLGSPPRLLQPSAAQKFSLSMDATDRQRNPTSRAGLAALVRAALDGARKGQAVSSTTQTSLMVGFPTTLDERTRALRAVLEGTLPAAIHAPTADDVESALQLMEAYQLKGCLLHAGEAAAVRERLRASKVPVVLGPLRFTDRDRTLENAGQLAKAGVNVAFGTDAPLSDPAALRLTAHLAVKYGMPPDAALRALTLEAAEILGAAHRIGSIDAGKDADLLLLSGSPLDLTSRVEAVIVLGTVVHEARQ